MYWENYKKQLGFSLYRNQAVQQQQSAWWLKMFGFENLLLLELVLGNLKRHLATPLPITRLQRHETWRRRGKTLVTPPIWGKPRTNRAQDDDMRRANRADVQSSTILYPWLNLRSLTQVGAWKVMLLSEVRDKRTSQRDCHLAPFCRAGWRAVCGAESIVLSKVRKLGSDWTSWGQQTRIGLAILGREILKKWLWPSQTDWSL